MNYLVVVQLGITNREYYTIYGDEEPWVIATNLLKHLKKLDNEKYSDSYVETVHWLGEMPDESGE